MSNPLSNIHEGMSVKDSAGENVGTVERIKMTEEDPNTEKAEQVQAEKTVRQGDEFLNSLLAAFRFDEVPEELHAQLLRKGFIRIDADGLLAADRYVTPDQIASVKGDTVHLGVARDDLIKRS